MPSNMTRLKIETDQDAITRGQKVLIHDDLPANRGKEIAIRASEWIKMCGGRIAGFSFILILLP